MGERVDNIISLAGLRDEDMSVADIRAFFEQLPEVLSDGHCNPPPRSGDTRVPTHDRVSDADATRGLLDDLTLVFRRALERSVSRREISRDEDLDGLAESLTMIFRGVVAMSRRGHSAEDLRQYLDIAMGVLD